MIDITTLYVLTVLAVGYILGIMFGLKFSENKIHNLRSAIIKHRSQKADDRCIEDDDELYEVLGDGIKCDRRVGNKEDMLINCKNFIEKRCESGGWKSYIELEKEYKELKESYNYLLHFLRDND